MAAAGIPRSDRQEGQEAVSVCVQAGLKLAYFKRLGCLETIAHEVFGLSLARAELLIRLASARPRWAASDAVDLSDPFCLELIQVAYSSGLDLIDALEAEE